MHPKPFHSKNTQPHTFPIHYLLSQSVRSDLNHLLYPVKQHDIGTIDVHLLVIHVIRFSAIIGLSQGLLQEMPAIHRMPDLPNVLIVDLNVTALQIFPDSRVLVVAENWRVFLVGIQDFIEFRLYEIAFFLVFGLVLPVEPAFSGRRPEHLAQKRVVLFQFLFDARF